MHAALNLRFQKPENAALLIELPSAKENRISSVLSVRNLKLKDVTNPGVIIQVFKTKRKDK